MGNNQGAFMTSYMLRVAFAALSLSVCVGRSSPVQGYTPAQVNQPSAPGNIRLLPGYVNTYVKPIDSAAAGSISKVGGLVISYDIGLDAGHYEHNPQWTKRAVWQTEQVVGGKRVVCIYTKSRELLITFPDDLANFHAKVRNQRDITDMMLMVLTYGSR
jgi:hypothetical protein